MLDSILRASTCIVTCGNSTCTGQLVHDGLVLTVRHGVLQAIESNSPISLRFPATSIADAEEHAATLQDQCEDLDACLLSFEDSGSRIPIPLAVTPPREGSQWSSYGFPQSRGHIGHYLRGEISQVLALPVMKVDLDLAVESQFALEDYGGLSGAPIACTQAVCGMIRLRLDGAIAAISTYSLASILNRNGVTAHGNREVTGTRGQSDLYAERREFQKRFEEKLATQSGRYLFLQGAHGIGKTVFCSTFKPQLARMVAIGTYSISPPFGSSNAFTRSLPEVFFDWINTSIGAYVTGATPRKETLTYVEMADRTQRLLRALSDRFEQAGQQGLIFIDGLNEIPNSDPNALHRFLGLLPNDLPPHITVVLSAPSYSAMAIPLDGRVISQNIITLPGLPAQACELYCRRSLTSELAHSAFVNHLCRKAQGHPLYLQYLIRHANDHPEDRSLDDFPLLDGPIETYYDRIWQKLLGDSDALALVGLIARLRPGLRIDDLSKALTDSEHSALRPTLARISHLLSTNDQAAIYHSSFACFLSDRTSADEVRIHTRLGSFCASNPDTLYGRFNLIHHLTRGNELSKSTAITACTQAWVDRCVAGGVAPDALISDLRDALSAATSHADPVATIRLLLLAQRVEFRYNTLFAQSANLTATALIAIGRSAEALHHVIRYDALITTSWNALQISYNLLLRGQSHEAFVVLDLVRRNSQVSLDSPDCTAADFVHACGTYIHACHLLRLTGRDDFVHEAVTTFRFARKVLRSNSDAFPEWLLRGWLAELHAIPYVHILCFSESYVPLAELWKGDIDEVFAETLLQGLLGYASLSEMFDLLIVPGHISGLFSEIEWVLEKGISHETFSSREVTDLFIRLGAPTSLVRATTVNSVTDWDNPTGSLRAANGVDVNVEYFHERMQRGRTVGFLTDDDLPICVPTFDLSEELQWLGSIDALLNAISHCEGRLRRAVADGDDILRRQTGQYLVEAVIPRLRFSLSQRVKWDRSYGLPEALLPELYENLSDTLRDTYPEGLSTFIEDIEARSSDQGGLYTEGYRSMLKRVVRSLLRLKPEPESKDPAFRLVCQWRDHVISGVENRHELVPELLALIPVFDEVGAHEVAAQLFDHVLRVSMGPSWYKEDQLGLLTTAITQAPRDGSLLGRVRAAAGYLERASGEMTFGRYVRYEKSLIPGILFAKERFRAGCDFYKDLTCGSDERLISEWQGHTFDAPVPGQGNRHVGGALEEQETILGMVKNAPNTQWRLRWALLEVFALGDHRHIAPFAEAFASIVNEVGMEQEALREVSERLMALLLHEFCPDSRSEFFRAFMSTIDPAHSVAFELTIGHLIAAGSEASGTTEVSFEEAESGLHSEMEEPAETANGDNDLDADLYLPGLFGFQTAIREADRHFAAATREYRLGNSVAASKAIGRMMETLQGGGWCIWGGLSSNLTEAELLLGKIAGTGSDLLRSYASLICKERYAAPWRIAAHLVNRLSLRLDAEERLAILDTVLEHVAYMVGDATSEMARFDYLAETETPDSDAETALFGLLLWLIDHPKWIRRDRAAAAVAWILGKASDFDRLAVEAAFTFAPKHLPDVLCGILDVMSDEDPAGLWDRVWPNINLANVECNCRHLQRITTLFQIAKRAEKRGSVSAKQIASRLSGQFRTGAIALPSIGGGRLPAWAECVQEEWDALVRLGVVTREVQRAVVETLTTSCIPLSIEASYALEAAVSQSFREPSGMSLSRWEAKVRHALNCALREFVPLAKLDAAKPELSTCNPSTPDSKLDKALTFSAGELARMIRKGDFTSVVGDANTRLLHCCGVVDSPVDNRVGYTVVEIVALLISADGLDVGEHGSTDPATFTSTGLPDLDATVDDHDTCFRLVPKRAFFGSFTPAILTPEFQGYLTVGANAARRISWRNGRSADIWTLGRPVDEGCRLEVALSALNLPPDRKLVWLVSLDCHPIAFVDEDGRVLRRLGGMGGS